MVLEQEGETMLSDSICNGAAHVVVDLTVGTKSGPEACALAVSPNQAVNWGQDRLRPEETLPAGTSRTFSFASGLHDLLLTDCNGATLKEEYGLDLTRDLTYRFTEQ